MKARPLNSFWWLCLFGLLVLSACSPAPPSLNPLSNPGEYKNDERLVGTWYIQEDQRIKFLHISEDYEGWMYAVLVMKDEIRNLEVYKGFTTPIGKDYFVNINVENTELGRELGQEAKYILALYEFTKDGGLNFLFLDNKQIVEAIESGHLKGRLVGQSQPEGHILDSTANLYRFIKQSDQSKLFGPEDNLEYIQKYGSWRRFNPPSRTQP